MAIRNSAFILLAIAVVVAVALSGASRPSITIRSPAGGERWEPGEHHTISWQTAGVPKGYKVSVIIRRLPPPPLPAEGQEFDPVVFTNLPNTGSVDWQIDPMYPDGTYVLDLEAYTSVPVTNPVSAESAPFTLTHPTLAADLYPLYAGADWHTSVAESVTIGTTTLAGASVTSVPVTDTMNPAGRFAPFEAYYRQKLKALGWSVADSLAAGGHVGGQTGYRKGAGTILVRFSIRYRSVSSTSPSECPCDLMLSLFSTGT